MTYAELAEALGIGGDSARNLVRRKRWQRKPGNDGLARVEVPIEYVAEHERSDPPTNPATDVPAEPPSSVPASPPSDGGIVQTLNRHIERLEKDVENLKTERDVERARAAQVDVLNAILEAERRHQDELRQNAEVLRQDRDRWAVQAHALAHPPAPERRGWWPFRRAG
jgi:predicted lipid-binding transport protein (Tim44 family)